MNQFECNVRLGFLRFLKWNLIPAMIIAIVMMSAIAFAQDSTGAWLSATDLQKVTRWIADEVATSRQTYCYRDSYGRGVGKPMNCAAGEQEDAGLCYTPCPDGFKGVGPVCWKYCPSGYTDDGATCRKDAHIYGKGSYGRGAGTPMKCAAGEQEEAGLCYTPCPAGFKGVGPVCWQYCPAGYTDDGATCRKDAHIYGKDSYGRGVGKAMYLGSDFKWHCAADHPVQDAALCYVNCNPGYKGVGPVCWRQCDAGYIDDGATCRKDAHIFGKETKTRGVGKPLSTCPSGQDKDALLCYPKCNSGFHGVGPVCWQDCPSGRIDCGAGCTTTTTACVEDTANMITAPIMLAVNICTMGSASGATQAASATSRLARATQAIKRIAAATKDIREIVRLVKQVGTVAYAANQEILLWVNEYVGDFKNMTNQKVVTELNNQFGSKPQALLWIKQQYALNHLTLTAQSDLDETSKNVLGAAAAFDPTGVTGVVDAFLKPVCVNTKSFPTVRLLAQTTSSPTVPAAPVGPAGYTYCAGENGTCSFSGSKTIAYGANGRFAYKTATNSINCNNGIFGDPIPNTVKACFVGPTAPAPPSGPAGYTYCAGENGTCSFSGTKTIAYGANGKFAYKTATNGINCNNIAFGGDPIYGTVKACFVGPTVPAASVGPAGYTYCAGENGTCSFSGTKTIAYGANGRFAYKTATNGINCNNIAFGGDPIYGTVKACYMR